MSDSENDLDYTEILRTLYEKNLYLQTQEQDNELKKKNEDSFTQYFELRNTFINMKDEFELNRIQMFKSNILLADWRDQVNVRMKEFDELLKKKESLKKKSADQQTQFDNDVMNWSKKIDLTVALDQEAHASEVQEGLSKIDSLQKEIELIQKIHDEEYTNVQNIDMNLKGVRLLTDELMEETADSELKLKNCNELESEINEIRAIISNIRKQIQ